MPNKTLSLRDEDLALWERAAKHADTSRQSLSALVSTALAKYLGEVGVCTVQMSKPYRFEQFEGRWIVGEDTLNQEDPWLFGHGDDERPAEYGYDNQDPSEWRVAIAETGRGKIAVYLHHWQYVGSTVEELHVFDTVDAAERALGSDPRTSAYHRTHSYGTVWQLARGKLTGTSGDRPVVWRDI